MIVVSDTTPLISLMKISQLNLLYHLFKEVYEDRLLSAEDIEKCIDILKSSGRHISNKLYEQLMNKLK